MRTSLLFGAKNFGFFEIYGVSARTRGFSQGGQGWGQFFLWFCVDVFHGWPLTKACSQKQEVCLN